jgi:hypothetical protein
LGLLLHSQEVRSPQDFEGAFARTTPARPDALLVLTDNLIAMHLQHIVAFATQERIGNINDLLVPAPLEHTSAPPAGGHHAGAPRSLDIRRRMRDGRTRQG